MEDDSRSRFIFCILYILLYVYEYVYVRTHRAIYNTVVGPYSSSTVALYELVEYSCSFPPTSPSTLNLVMRPLNLIFKYT
jgi:hypothetical protein